jgi:hypothetical protein
VITTDSLQAEIRLADKVQSLLKATDNVFDGDTHRADRMRKLRMQILTNRYETVSFTVKDGKHVTIRQQFYRAYQEELE